jgi:hypothetical protein
MGMLASLVAGIWVLFPDAGHADNFRIDPTYIEIRREPELRVSSTLTRTEVARLAQWRRVPVYFAYAPPSGAREKRSVRWRCR